VLTGVRAQASPLRLGRDPRYDRPIIRQTNGSSAAPAPTDAGDDAGDGPLTTLRGASVEVDPRRVACVAVALGLAALAAVAVILFVAGVDKNAEITGLRQQGVRVEVTVTRCIGLLGGSGSNGVGNSCSGTFVLAGKDYRSSIPGNTLYASGTRLRLVTIKDDPGILATVRQLQGEHASWKVFFLPTALLVVLFTLVSAVAVLLRRGREGGGSATTPLTAGLPRRQPLLG